MKTILIGLILSCALSLHAQMEQGPGRITSKRDSLECIAIPGDQQKIQNQDAVKRFNADLLYCSEPSTLSVIGTDYHHNTSDRSQQKKNFILNANLAFPIGIYGKRWYSNKLHIVHGFQLTPQVLIRILQNDTVNHNDSSLPVRTPSYLPRVTYFVSPLKLWNRDVDRNTSKRFYFLISAFHHSNGQDGQEFAKNGKYKNRVNTYNGNFGENVVLEFGGGYILYTFRTTRSHGDNKKRDSCPDHQLQFKLVPGISDVQHSMYSRLTYEWHPKVLSNSDLWKQHYYGLNRVNFMVGYIASPSDRDLFFVHDTAYYRSDYKMIEKHRVVLTESIITDRILMRGPIDNSHHAKLMERVNICLTYYNRQLFQSAPNTALFVQVGYFGSDIYNIYFDESMIFLRFGISVGVFNSGNYCN